MCKYENTNNISTTPSLQFKICFTHIQFGCKINLFFYFKLEKSMAQYKEAIKCILSLYFITFCIKCKQSHVYPEHKLSTHYTNVKQLLRLNSKYRIHTKTF